MFFQNIILKRGIIFCCLFFIFRTYLISQQKKDTVFVPTHLISLKTGVSFNNNKLSANFVSSTLELRFSAKGGDTIGYFRTNTTALLSNPYINIGLRRQTKKDRGFYFGFTYTAFRNKIASRHREYYNESFDGTNYHYLLSEKRGDGYAVNHLFRFELLLFKNIKHTHFEIGLVNGDWRLTDYVSDITEKISAIETNKQIPAIYNYIPETPPGIINKKELETRYYSVRKNGISKLPYVPLSIGIEQYFDLEKTRISVGGRVVYSKNARYIAYQFYTGFHIKYLAKRDRLKHKAPNQAPG
ncbi:MAG TPA: hypothetical protein VGF30_16085 [Bacteroidia bacterium]